MARKIHKIDFDAKKGLEEVKVQLASDNGDDIDVTMNLSLSGPQDGLQSQLLNKIFEKEVSNLLEKHLQPVDTVYPKDDYFADDFPPLTGMLLKHGFTIVEVRNYTRPNTELVAKGVTLVIAKDDFAFEKVIDIKFQRTYIDQMFTAFGPDHVTVDVNILKLSPRELEYGLLNVWNVAPEYRNIINLESYVAKEDHYTKNADVKMKVSVKAALQKYVIGKKEKTFKFFSEEFKFSDVEMAIEQVANITSIRSLTPAPQIDTSKFILDTTAFTGVGFAVGKPTSINPNSPGQYDKDEREVLINLPISIYDYETEIEMLVTFERSYYEDLLKNFNPKDVRLTNLSKFISTDDPEFTEALLSANLETDKEVEVVISQGSLIRDHIDKRKFGFSIELSAGTFNSLLDVEGNLGIGINPPQDLIASFTDFRSNGIEKIGGAQIAETLNATGIKEDSVSSLQLDTREIEIRDL